MPRPIEQILELARWAPSGDNTQPWRFEIIDDQHLLVHGFDTREHCVYDPDGHSSQIAMGALLETIKVAATQHGWRARITRRVNTADTHLLFDVRFEVDSTIQASPLIQVIPLRSVQRRALKMRRLTLGEKQALEQSVGADYRIRWLEGTQSKWRIARLLFNNAKIRLTMPEAYKVHSSVIEWNARFSEDKIPDQAVGLDAMATKLMRWVMQSWQRVEFFNTYLAGTWLARVELDLIPAMACGAHFVLIANKADTFPDSYVQAGQAVQRLWLTATSLHLQLQPELTPLIFASYVRHGKRISARTGIDEKAAELVKDLVTMIEPDCLANALFMGRVGAGTPAQARSLRLAADKLAYIKHVD